MCEYSRIIKLHNIWTGVRVSLYSMRSVSFQATDPQVLVTEKLRKQRDFQQLCIKHIWYCSCNWRDLDYLRTLWTHIQTAAFVSSYSYEELGLSSSATASNVSWSQCRMYSFSSAGKRIARMWFKLHAPFDSPESSVYRAIWVIFFGQAYIKLSSAVGNRFQNSAYETTLWGSTSLSLYLCSRRSMLS